MLRRLALFVVLTALVVTAAVWLADRPGAVTVHWQGWRVDTSVPVLGVALLLVLAVLATALRLVRAVVRGPARLVAARRARRVRDGYRALSDGLAAVAVGDRRAAGTLARRADRLLADSSLTGLLTAQAAELAGDAGEAERRLKGMVERPETAFLGLKGLTTLALQQGDRTAALDYARRAWASNSGAADGLATTLFDLQARAGQWAEAELTLTEAKKRGALSGADLLRRRALALTGRAAAAERDGDAAAAARLALEATRADPMFVPAAAAAAGLLHRQGRQRKAAAVVEAAWRCAPHPALVEAWIGLAPAETPLMRVKRMERLVRANPDSADGHLGLARAALAARLWGLARTHLESAVKLRASEAAFTLLARLEREERQDEAAAATWTARAASAPADPVWLCGACAGAAAAWSAACPACGAIDTLAWKSPATAALPTPG
jgi:HemY protein